MLKYLYANNIQLLVEPQELNLMDGFLTLVTAYVSIYGCVHFFSSFALLAGYWQHSQDNEYPVPEMYALMWIFITGFPGLITGNDHEDGLFWRRIKGYMDRHRSNAGAIDACKTNIRLLKRLPKTDSVRSALREEERKLRSLRSHDNEMMSTIGIDSLTSSLQATDDHVAVSPEIRSEVRRLSRS